MRAAVLAVAAAMVVSISPAAVAAPMTYPPPVDEGFPAPRPPEVSADAWLLYDESTDTVLASRASAERRSIASTTKIMTALVVLERADLDEMVRISQAAADTGEREIDLVAGEEVTVEALLKASMIHSANDAATAMAEHVGGSVEGFVGLMNQRAERMGLSQTRFANPHGLDDPNHYSSARDLLALSRAAMANPRFRDIVRSRAVVFPDAPDGTPRLGTTTNLLLGEYEGALGVKTGFTNLAQLTFVASAEREGRRLYAVVLGSEGRRSHFADARALLDHGFEELRVYGVLGAGTRYASSLPAVGESPLVEAARMETLIHLANQGLAAQPSPPALSPEDPEPIPVMEVERRPPPQPTWSDALSFWWERLTGEGT